MSDALLLVAALAVPLGAAWIAYAAAVAPCRRGEPPAFFALALRVSWIAIGGMLLWIPALLHVGLPLLREVELSPGIELPLIGLAVLGPPLVVAAGLGLMVHDVARRAGMTEWSWGTAVADAMLQLVAALVPVVLLLAALDAARVYLFREATIAAITGVAVLALAAGARARASGLTPHAITSGPLRDRVFDLAAHAKVKLKQLYVVPFRRYRMANAFAVKGNVVILTDLLLRELGRDEVDAILAHEMAHLARRDPEKIALAMVGTMLVAALAFPIGGWWAVTVVAVAGLLLQMAMRRSIEYATDARAMDFGVRPEAFVTGLARLNHLAQVPLRWSRAAELFLTHPSTERRTLRVGARAGIDLAQVAGWIASPPAVTERHPIPAALDEGRVFDSALRRRVSGRLIWTLLAITALVPALVVAALGPFGPVPRLPGIALAALAAFVTWQIIWAFGAARPLVVLRDRLRERLLGGGDAAPEASFVGLAPGHAARVFEGFTQWDLGFVSLHPGRLDYVGEEARFSLRADEVRDVRLDVGLPAWIPVRAVRIRWERADGTSGVFGLLPSGLGSVFASRAGARRLHDRIAAWHAAGGAAGAQAPDTGPVAAGAIVRLGASAGCQAPPSAEGVTSASPRETIAPRNLVTTVIVVWVMSLAATFLVGLPLHPFARGVFDAWLASMIAYGLAIAPIALWREPAAAGRGEAPARRAA